jgi:hypothetical protein
MMVGAVIRGAGFEAVCVEGGNEKKEPEGDDILMLRDRAQ